MRNMQSIVYASLLGLVLVPSSSLIAQATDIPALSSGAQLTVIGLLFALITGILTKMIPAEAERRSQELDRMLEVHKETSKEIGSNIKEMTAEMRIMRESSTDLNETLKSRPCMLDDALYQKLMNQKDT